MIISYLIRGQTNYELFLKSLHSTPLMEHKSRVMKKRTKVLIVSPLNKDSAYASLLCTTLLFFPTLSSTP